MKRTTDLVNGDIRKNMLTVLYPLLVSTVFSILYTLANGIIVGQTIGSHALAIVGGSASYLSNAVFNFTGGIMSGAMVLVAQAVGANDLKNLNRTVKAALAVVGLAAAAATLLYQFAARGLLVLMNVPEELLDASVRFIQQYAWGFVPYSLAILIVSLQRGMGQTVQPAGEMIVLDLVYICTDFLFVKVLDLGIAGVSVSFLTAYGLFCLYLLYQLQREMGVLSSRIPLDRKKITAILRLGVPAGLTSMFYPVANSFISAAINRLSPATISAYSIDAKIEMIYWNCISAFCTAFTTITAANFGAGRPRRVKQAVKTGLILAFEITIPICALVWLTRGWLYSLFTSDAEVSTIGVQIVAFMMPCLLTYPLLEVYSSAAKAVGKALVPTNITLIGICATRILWIISLPDGYSAIQVLVCYPLSWVVTGLAMFLYYRHLEKTMPQLKIEQSA